MPSGIKDKFFGDDMVRAKQTPPHEGNSLYFILLNKIADHTSVTEKVADWMSDLKPYLERPATEREIEMFINIDLYESYHLYWMFFIQADKMRCLVEKGAFYGRSFARLGWYSVFHNIQRKYDAIEIILFENAVKKGDTKRIFMNEGANFEDGLRDLSNYSDLGWTYLLEKLTQEEHSNG
jgi:hypothetical protein